MNIQRSAGRTFVVFFKYPWQFILYSLAAMLLSAVTLGILAPAMWLGMGGMFLRAADGVKPSAEGLLKYIDKTLTLALLGFIAGISIMTGLILLLIPGFILAALWFYAPYYMADSGTGIMESLKLSAFTVNKNSLFGHVALVVSLALILAVGFNTVVLSLAAYPLCAGFSAFLFKSVKEG